MTNPWEEFDLAVDNLQKLNIGMRLKEKQLARP